MLDHLSNKMGRPDEGRDKGEHRLGPSVPSTFRGGKCPDCGGPLRERVGGDPPILDVWCLNCDFRTTALVKVHKDSDG
jgi:hypothetical protein